MTIAIVTLIVLIFLNAFFAATEIALIGLNSNKVKRKADEGDKKAGMLYKLIEEPSRFLSTIQIGITLAGFLASAFAADFFAGPLAQTLYELGFPIALPVLQTISVIVITIILSYFTLVFGELVPKQLALQKAEAISNFAATPITWLLRLSYPVVKLLTFSTNTVIRIFGVDPNATSDEATEEEIRMMVDIGGDTGTIQKTEKVMIHNVFEFNDRQVSDIITHRTDMSALSIDASLKETIELVNEKRYTRFPVYEEDIDRIVGILHVKDLLHYMEVDKTFHLSEIIRKPHFVLETQRVDTLFAEMQKSNSHIAIVLDEYGGTEGLITIEDIIEELVGEILSESDATAPEQEIKQIEPNKFIIDGITHLYLLEKFLQLDLPTEEFDTLNGFLIGEIGFIPSIEERPIISYKNIIFEVTEVADNRIKKVIATIHEEDIEKIIEDQDTP
ncbi:hemolysin family protein [Oceanobacillus profundus]|uniref:hemolysin family protein n=1 Tax=Oceanobacillus TaxID=182709 RepID=UPI0026E42BB5|nr:hemolysin family protein [Oceanobacillus profundus]MDO6451471.1 hemolysin family protein [Oceanobacillus profundus]